MTSTYRSYHSDLKWQYNSGFLQKDLVYSIPRSTRKRWKDKTIQSFWAPYPVKESRADEHGRLLGLEKENASLKIKAKALFYIVCFYSDFLPYLLLNPLTF